MKKYLISVLISSFFLIGFSSITTKVSASDIPMRDFINLLITIGAITPDKIPAVNAYLATINTNNTATNTNAQIQSTSTTNEDVYIDIDDNSIHIPQGGSATISWSSNGSQGCNFSRKDKNTSSPYIKTILPAPVYNTYNLTEPKEYAREVGNLTETTTYVISCTGLGGTATENFTVDVSEPLKILSYKVNCSGAGAEVPCRINLETNNNSTAIVKIYDSQGKLSKLINRSESPLGKKHYWEFTTKGRSLFRLYVSSEDGTEQTETFYSPSSA